MTQIEEVMQPRSGSYSVKGSLPEKLSPLLTEAFFSQPLLGNINPSHEQREYLQGYARNVLDRAIKNNWSDLTDFESDIVTLETVLLLQNYDIDDDKAERNDNAAFWEFICNQYDILYDRKNFSSSITYRLFRDAVTNCFRKHKRLFADSGKRYYTSLLTHALAPKRKFFTLFEQIYHFYIKSLKYQFIEDDTAFTAFSSAMKKRFDGDVKNVEENVYIKSLQSSSAIKLLFSKCPCYMSLFVKNIVRDIDMLVSTEDFDDASYVAKLLKTWNEKRSSEIRTSDRKERLRVGSDLVETDFRRIGSFFQLINDKVALIIPKIRLGEKSENLPEISIYQDDRLVYKERLRWFGDPLCITSEKTEIPIDDIERDDSDKINLRAIISYGGVEIYNSENKLYREAIVFNEDGVEIKKSPEFGNIFFLYAAASSIIDERIENSPQFNMLPSSAQFFRVIMSDDTYIIVNGKNLFPMVETSDNFHMGISENLSKSEKNRLKYIKELI